MQLPKKREFGWALKPLSSAKTSVNVMENGQIEVLIEHEVIKGVTTEMLEWWFVHFIKLKVIKEGVTYPAYFLWHPYDHIAVSSDGGAIMRAGDGVRIQECFQRNPKFELDEKGLIAALDKTQLQLQGKKFGKVFMDLVHRFHDVPEGAAYRSRLVLGVE